jgi:hypothetical protein
VREQFTDSEMVLIESFEKFHDQNPHVYEALVDMARYYLRETSKDKIAIATLFERVRWEFDITTTTSGVSCKMPNNHRAFYARLIMAQENDLKNAFDICSSVASRWMLNRLDDPTSAG